MKIAGKHKSIPNEVKKALKCTVGEKAKIVMNDICSCRHKYTPGTLKVTDEAEKSIKIRAYFDGGIVNLFVKFNTEAEKAVAVDKIKQKYSSVN